MTNDDLHSIATERNEAARIERLAHHMLSIRESVDEMKGAMKEMASAITRLALVEERQAAVSTTIERLVQSLEKVDERLRRLEVSEPLQAKATEWVQSAVWAAAAAAVMFMAAKAGLI